MMKKPFLIAEQETLFIPLYCKAKKNNPILVDPKAQEILQQVDYKFSSLDVPAKTCASVLLRAKKLDEYTQAFLVEHPDSLVLHLGCGLDARYDRLRPKSADWFDLYLPDVIKLQRTFFDETDRVHMIASSVTELGEGYGGGKRPFYPHHCGRTTHVPEWVCRQSARAGTA